MHSFLQKSKEIAQVAWKGTKDVASHAWEGTKTFYNDAKDGISQGVEIIERKIDDFNDVLRKPDSISDKDVVDVNYKLIDIIQACETMSRDLNLVLENISLIESTLVEPIEDLSKFFTEEDGELFSRTQKFLYDSRSIQATFHLLASELYPQNVVGPYTDILNEYNEMKPKIKELFELRAKLDKEKGIAPQEDWDQYNRKKQKYITRVSQLVIKLKEGNQHSFYAFLQYYNQILTILEPIFSSATTPQLPYVEYASPEQEIKP